MLKRLLMLTLLPLTLHAEDLPAPVKAIEKQGITIIKSFDAPGGMKGYLGKYQEMGVTIYVTPDGKHAISGYMYDEAGTNLSEKLFNQELYGPAGRELWQRMEKADWILDGQKNRAARGVRLCRPLLPLLQTVLAAGAPVGGVRQGADPHLDGRRNQTGKPGGGGGDPQRERSGQKLA